MIDLFEACALALVFLLACALALLALAVIFGWEG